MRHIIEDISKIISNAYQNTQKSYQNTHRFTARGLSNAELSNIERTSPSSAAATISFGTVFENITMRCQQNKDI